MRCEASARTKATAHLLAASASLLQPHVLVHALVASSAADNPHGTVSMFQAIILGAVQGVAELFPISSLGHTVLLPSLLGWHQVVNAQSDPESFWLAFVVALHVGNALALLIYFWKDWVEIIRAWLHTVAARRIETPTERLAWLVIIATIPAGILGLLLEHPLRVALAHPIGAAIFLMVNGFILFGAERLRRRPPGQAPGRARAGDGVITQRLDALTYRQAGLLGVAQSSALIAGISREGVVMGAGLRAGLTHENAARFSFLMATPVILAAGLLKIPDLLGPLGRGVRGQALVGAIVAGVVSVLAIRFLLRFFKSNNLNPFGWYCVLAGLGMTIYLSV